MKFNMGICSAFLALLFLFSACTSGGSYAVPAASGASAVASDISSLGEAMASAPKELQLCGETYSLDVEELTLNETFTAADGAKLADAKSLTSLNVTLSASYLREQGNAALDFLINCPGLTQLSLYIASNPNGVLPLEPLTYCPNLRTFCLCGSTMADLTLLARCPALKELTLDGANVDLAQLAGMELESLRLAGYANIEPLKEMKSLGYLYPSGFETGLSALGELGLQNLNIVDLRIEPMTIDPQRIAPLTTLETLQFSDASISDISFLLPMENLKTLVIWVDADNASTGFTQTEITAEDMSLLETLKITIPVEQLKEFLQRDRSKLVICCRWQ